MATCTASAIEHGGPEDCNAALRAARHPTERDTQATPACISCNEAASRPHRGARTSGSTPRCKPSSDTVPRSDIRSSCGKAGGRLCTLTAPGTSRERARSTHNNRNRDCSRIDLCNRRGRRFRTCRGSARTWGRRRTARSRSLHSEDHPRLRTIPIRTEPRSLSPLRAWRRPPRRRSHPPRWRSRAEHRRPSRFHDSRRPCWRSRAEHRRRSRFHPYHPPLLQRRSSRPQPPKATPCRCLPRRVRGESSRLQRSLRMRHPRSHPRSRRHRRDQGCRHRCKLLRGRAITPRDRENEAWLTSLRHRRASRYHSPGLAFDASIAKDVKVRRSRGHGPVRARTSRFRPPRSTPSRPSSSTTHLPTQPPIDRPPPRITSALDSPRSPRSSDPSPIDCLSTPQPPGPPRRSIASRSAQPRTTWAIDCLSTAQLLQPPPHPTPVDRPAPERPQTPTPAGSLWISRGSRSDARIFPLS
jgi:hypothetical protein